MNKEKEFMLRAVALARKGLGRTSPNPPVGCVIVKNNKIIAEGFHKKFGANHAEVEALKKAGKGAKGAHLYVTLEPCAHYGKTPPCVNPIIKSGIKKIIVGAIDPNSVNNGKGLKKLRSSGIKVKLSKPSKELAQLNAPFIKYVKKQAPFVTLKLAQSLDGKIATNSGDSKWISSAGSRRFVHKLREETDVVMIGAGTLLKDNPLLTARLARSSKKNQPIKIIIDSKLRAPMNAKIFSKKSPAQTIIVTTELAPKKKIQQLLKRGVEILPIKSKKKKVNLKALMKILANRGIVNVLTEGGNELASSLLSEGLVDRILFFIAPKIIANKTEVKQALNVKDLCFRKMSSDFLFEGYL